MAKKKKKPAELKSVKKIQKQKGRNTKLKKGNSKKAHTYMKEYKSLITYIVISLFDVILACSLLSSSIYRECFFIILLLQRKNVLIVIETISLKRENKLKDKTFKDVITKITSPVRRPRNCKKK